MNEELEAFRDALRQAGQPWSRRGVMIVGAGIAGLLIAQVAGTVLTAYLAIASLAVIMVGWMFLVVAFVKRRAWAKAHPLREPPLVIDGEPL